MAEVKKVHWALDMAIRAKGSTMRHFRTVGNIKRKQSKIFFSDAKVFVVEFENSMHTQTKEIIRGPYDSLLPIEAEIAERYQNEGVF